MLLVNRLTVPGGVRRVELRPDLVRVVLRDGTEKVYLSSKTEAADRSDFGALDWAADKRES